MQIFRRIAETSDIPTIVYAEFFMVVYHFKKLLSRNRFQFAEQHDSILSGTLYSITITGFGMDKHLIKFMPDI